MALFCFPDEHGQPLARSQTNTVQREDGRRREVMFLWENKKAFRQCTVKRLTEMNKKLFCFHS